MLWHGYTTNTNVLPMSYAAPFMDHLTSMNFILVLQLYSSKSQAKPYIAYDTQLFQILLLHASLFNMEIYQLYCLLMEFFTSVK